MKKKSVLLIVFSILVLLAFISLGYSAEPSVILKKGHLPTFHGIKAVWYSNADNNVSVNLSFTPPWDMTKGPKNRQFKETHIELKDAFNGQEFPDATCVVEQVIGTEKEYQFFKKVQKGMYWLGSSTPPQNQNIDNIRFEPAIRLLMFPAKVGAQSVQDTKAVTGDGTWPLTFKIKVVGKGKVIVGAGTFNDAVMVQGKVEFKVNDPDAEPFIVYQWYAPFIGKVAEISSLDGETKELFTTASDFYWLKSLEMP